MVFEVVIPKIGESVLEAVITKWYVKPGDIVHEDDLLFDIATDKVDSEIPSAVEGIIKEILFKENDTVAVGTVVAIIETDTSEAQTIDNKSEEKKQIDIISEVPKDKSSRFYSPLVKTLAKEKQISSQELDSIDGTGLGGRVRKEDIFQFIENKSSKKISFSAPH